MGKSNSLEGIKTIEDFNLKGKNVFIRLDLNVPIKNGKITDETRIDASLPTLKYAIDHGAKVIVASHLGRPKNKEKEFSLEPVGKTLSEKLKINVNLIEDPASDAPKNLLKNLRPKELILLENIRYDPREEKNDPKLSQILANYTEIYINDAFGTAHRAHCSTAGIAEFVKDKGVGFLMKKEIENLGILLDSPKNPFIAILGGAKVSDKIAVIENLIDKVDVFIIGGAMAYTFLAAQGKKVGNSKVEKEKINFAKELLERIDARNKTCLLPIDHIISKDLTGKSAIETTPDANIPEGWIGLDIGPKSQSSFEKAISKGKMIFWNGPMGLFETKPFDKGTFFIAKTLAEVTKKNSALTVVGGGDSASAMNESGFADKVSHISTGGGASLEFIQGDKLPGIENLRTKKGGGH